MTIGRLTTALTLAVATAWLGACTSDATPAARAPGTGVQATLTSAAPSGGAPDQEAVGEVPLVQGRGHDQAVGAYGADEVAAAATTVARTARIALADWCDGRPARWTPA